MIRLALPLCILTLTLPALALELGTPFRDNAVLQRGMPVPVWGWSKPGSTVTVAFAGQSKSTVTDGNGKWTATLNPLTASAAPAEMTISAGDSTRKLSNILVGEVWLASGQSNMQWLASKCDVGRVLQAAIAERVAAGTENPPLIREAQVTNYYATQQPIERADAEWSLDQANFSAIAFAFAYKLHRELQVPIGILNCSFSSTAIQAWTPRAGFATGTDDYTKAIHQRVLEADPTTPEHKQAWNAYYQRVATALAKGQAVPTDTPGITKSNRDATWLYNARMNPMVPYAIRGAIWNQGYASAGEGLAYYHNLHSLIRGWRAVWNRPDLPVYFHQFYSPGVKADSPNHPSISPMAEMRLGTWLARDIPNAGMASQIDVTGSIHYYRKTLPGERLARHALKHQYGKPVIADGPSYNSYRVEHNKLIVSFDHADDGLFVGQVPSDNKGPADPFIIPTGATRLKLFYLADADRVWHPAAATIKGNEVVLSAPGVTSPRGVSYGTGGIGFQPNLYNTAMLPASPFIFYDHKLVTSDTWPDSELKIHGYQPDPATVGLTAEWYKMPILSTQFRDNAVLQADQPITFFGSAAHDYGYEADGDAIIHFSFNGIEKSFSTKDPNYVNSIPATDSGGRDKLEWRVTVPAMPASAEPKTLKVTFTINGQLAHQRTATNIVVGDVWYVAAPPAKLNVPTVQATNDLVRVMTRKAKRSSFRNPSRFSVCVSRTPKNRFACEWTTASDGLAAALGQRLHAESGNPVGIIFMQSTASKNDPDPPLKNWIPFSHLDRAPSLRSDFQNLAVQFPGTPIYAANVDRYLSAWKTYWSDYVADMMRTGAVPDGAPWGAMPKLAGTVSSTAGETYNVLTHSFTPAALHGAIFIASPTMLADDNRATFPEQLATLFAAWRDKFGPTHRLIATLPPRANLPATSFPGCQLIQLTAANDAAPIIDAAAKRYSASPSK